MWKCLDMSYSTAIDLVGVLFLANSAAEDEKITGHCCLMGDCSSQLRSDTFHLFLQPLQLGCSKPSDEIHTMESIKKKPKNAAVVLSHLPLESGFHLPLLLTVSWTFPLER